MTSVTPRAPTPLQPRLKASAVADTSSASAAAAASSSTPSPKLLRPPGLPSKRPLSPSPPSSSSPPSRARHHPSSTADPLSPAATLALIRRTLCPAPLSRTEGGKNRTAGAGAAGAGIEGLLPPLTSSNAVDVELYALLAIIVREFVYTWYARITPDHVFVDEVVRIVAHCTRGVEQRLRKVDLESLVLDEIPELLEAHVKGYRAAHNSLHPPPLSIDSRTIYHALWPSRALSPVPDENDPYSVASQRENESAYRQLLVQGMLAVLLPTEDLENQCLMELVGQIFSEMILGGGLGGKACEPWLIWEGITKAVEVAQAQLPNSKAQDRVDKSSLNPHKTGTNVTAAGKIHILDMQQSMEKTFWLVLQYGFLLVTALRAVISTMATSSSLPSRLPSMRSYSAQPSGAAATHRPPAAQASPLKEPILGMKLWTCVSTVLEMDARMPWLLSAVSLVQWMLLYGPGQVGGTDTGLDRFLSHTIRSKLLSPSLLPPLLRSVRGALFPNNAPGPPRVTPDPAAQRAIRQRCAEALLQLVPARVQDVFFGSTVNRDGVDVDEAAGAVSGGSGNLRGRDDSTSTPPAAAARSAAPSQRVRQVEELLDVFSDPYCNKHLMYGLAELIIVKLVPELVETGVEELLEERFS